jgi:hypothetical protein
MFFVSPWPYGPGRKRISAVNSKIGCIPYVVHKIINGFLSSILRIFKGRSREIKISESLENQ